MRGNLALRVARVERQSSEGGMPEWTLNEGAWQAKSVYEAGVRIICYAVADKILLKHT